RAQVGPSPGTAGWRWPVRRSTYFWVRTPTAAVRPALRPSGCGRILPPATWVCGRGPAGCRQAGRVTVGSLSHPLENGAVVLVKRAGFDLSQLRGLVGGVCA